jgi:hypothetical protein
LELFKSKKKMVVTADSIYIAIVRITDRIGWLFRRCSIYLFIILNLTYEQRKETGVDAYYSSRLHSFVYRL